VFQLCGYNLSRLIGDLGDARFIISITEYNYQWLIGNYSHYWDGFFFYPDKEAISYSDNLLGITPLYFIIRIFFSDFLTAFQILIIACHALNFLSCYYCFYRLSGNRYAAAGGAFIFAFSLALNGIHNHPQFTFRFCMPFFFYFMYRYLNSLQIKSLSLAFLFLLIQFYLGAYLGVFLMVGGIFFTATWLLFNYGIFRNFKKMLVQWIVVVPLFALLLLPMLYHYYKRVVETGFYSDYNFYMETVPRFSSWFKAFPGSFCWPFLVKTSVDSQYSWLHQLFPGGVVILTIIISAYFALKKQRMQLILFSALALFLCFTIYFHGHTMYGFLMKIPGVKTARVVSRFVTVIIFFAAWLFVLNFSIVTQKYVKQALIIAVLLGAILIADNYCRPQGFKTFSKTECWQRISSLENKITAHADYKKYPAFAYAPGTIESTVFLHVDAMLCALKMKTKTVNGYSSSCNKAFGPFWKNIDSAGLSYWCREMNFREDSLIIVK
jgi:hypothetical protein